MLSVVKMLLKGEVGGSALNSHGNYIVDHGISWENRGIVFLNFCGNPEICYCASQEDQDQPRHQLSLTRALSVIMKKASVLSYPLSQRRAE